jgi:4-hydroxyphenylacetate 3-monooxygenase
MGARRGEQVIQRLKEQPPEIWHRGSKVADITTEPGFANGVRSLAELYDRQWDEPDKMLFDGEGGQKIGRSHQIARTLEDVKAIGDMMQTWSEHTFGMMGRSPDYLNRAMAGYAGGAEFLSKQDPKFTHNVRSYHKFLSEEDLCLTHTLIHPQANRSVPVSQQADPYIGARIKVETDAGIVIKGARMLATLPISDEIMVFPSTLLRAVEEDAPYAYGFAIANNTPGLKFICRESLDYGRNHYDHPLGSRFEEMDAVVVFDDVFVPWERVFLYRDVDICNQAYAATGAIVNMSHQVMCKDIAKTGFVLGLISLMIDSIGVEKIQHIHEKVAEVWVNMETMKAFRRAAEADAKLNDYGVMMPAWDPLDAGRNLFPRLYPRMVEIIQQIGASGLVAMPTMADVNGPMAEDIKKYYQSARMEAAERIPLFRLAWDAAASAFGSRQVLYERFFFGDPVRMAGVIFEKKDRSRYMEMVREFLKRAVENPESQG